MSPSVKLGLLTLVSSAAAIPHYGHSKFHKASGGYSYPIGTGSGAPFPTGGYGHNHTLPHGSGAPSHEPTTTILQSETSTLTIYSTVYASPSPASAGAEDVSSGAASSAAAQCGPATVYVTATNKVTVTVTPGSSSSSSSSAAVYVAPSSAEAVVSSSSAYKPKPSSSAAAVASSAPAYKVSSAAAVASSSEKASLTITLGEKAPSSVAAVYSSAAAIASSVVSSAAAATSSTSTSPSYSGAKRGLAFNDESLCAHFNSGSFGFSYNWAQTGSACASAPFVPMVNKPSDSTAEAWLANVDTAVKNGATMVMGFNECDIATQCNLSPAQACADWKTYMNPIRAAHPKVTILGPSVSNSGTDGQGLSWLQEFVDQCPEAEWDATNIHFYDIPDGDNCENTVTRFTSHFADAAKFGKKVFVTEFGLNSGSATAAQASEFLSGALSFMDGEDTCSGYAYFMVGTDTAMNELNSVSGLSSVGETYNS